MEKETQRDKKLRKREEIIAREKNETERREEKGAKREKREGKG